MVARVRETRGELLWRSSTGGGNSDAAPPQGTGGASTRRHALPVSVGHAHTSRTIPAHVHISLLARGSLGQVGIVNPNPDTGANRIYYASIICIVPYANCRERRPRRYPCGATRYPIRVQIGARTMPRAEYAWACTLTRAAVIPEAECRMVGVAPMTCELYAVWEPRTQPPTETRDPARVGVATCY